eukprot:GHVN01006380.1.p1 GENE.GHVN01006380.1~~GHVN01006380.1.p1  ORF type:complete len:469 (+),score=56.17 GHVN01006380.1:1144-2550(+)
MRVDSPQAVTRPPAPTQRSESARHTGICLVVSLIHIILVAYLAYVFILLKPMLYPNPTCYSLIVPILFHVVFILFLMSFFKSSSTDPGRVPAEYAFHMGDERKRRRYCKSCNVWKPDRTHHCAACNRCVLNMDHHCPWLNNCVGFENRKYFIQLLIYGLILSVIIAVHGLAWLLTYGGETFPSSSQSNKDHALNGNTGGAHGNQGQDQRVITELGGILEFFVVCVLEMFAFILVLVLIPFTRFHLKLVMMNSTTIESMDTSADPSRYDIGSARGNCQQVFGRVPLLYGLPCGIRATRPVGDGVNWGEQYMRLARDNPQHPSQQRNRNREAIQMSQHHSASPPSPNNHHNNNMYKTQHPQQNHHQAIASNATHSRSQSQTHQSNWSREGERGRLPQPVSHNGKRNGGKGGRSRVLDNSATSYEPLLPFQQGLSDQSESYTNRQGQQQRSRSVSNPPRRQKGVQGDQSQF